MTVNGILRIVLVVETHKHKFGKINILLMDHVDKRSRSAWSVWISDKEEIS